MSHSYHKVIDVNRYSKSNPAFHSKSEQLMNPTLSLQKSRWGARIIVTT